MRCLWTKASKNTCLAAENARLHEARQQVPLLRDHVRQLIHLRLEEGDLFGGLDELVVVLIDVPL